MKICVACVAVCMNIYLLYLMWTALFIMHDCKSLITHFDPHASFQHAVCSVESLGLGQLGPGIDSGV